MARAKMQIISLTDAAADRVKALMSRAEKPVGGLKLGIRKGGCAGMEYTMAYADAPSPGDEVVEDKGARVFVEPQAVLFLLGTQMDYKTEKMSSAFVFSNPNQTSACGCGESIAITPATAAAFAAAR